MEPKRLIIVAVGGQGNLLASHVLGEAALMSGVPVRMSEIHGMAQRGGVVESALVFGDAKSTIISDGEADLFVSFEPCEALRALKKCNANTVAITNTRPLPPFTAFIGRGTYPDLETVTETLKNKTGRLIAFDATALAEEAGNPMCLNMVLLGTLIGTGVLPITADSIREAIRTRTKADFVEMNLAAFEKGFARAA
ncbi:indolepyruvate ferredoxin oxidoreductase subunit IorB [Desulfobotulus alkaliphilus]|uniref:Indolepyruvate ferredoxin oxidoreductase subunit IorB n=1 Tax=Desulfobotulus alkaliphilus TaxID=622671 RepID=A0A562RXY0_9BACT|nr:indolepyruvate oxidoreductase subunit beta [Desulfobotulus alkaliphilus]TWI73290.1 indolepyruvate ferredoxin oxidoreductase subunit IorB [Desulfobotulus alkaliphilus]